MITGTTPRIYVACLASYNSGILHGDWIDCDQDADDIRSEIEAMLSESTADIAEEYAIHDHEGFHGLTISEYSDIDDVAELARLIDEHGEAYGAYVDLVGTEYATESEFQDVYAGHYESEQDYAEETLSQCYDLDNMMGALSSYFDYERYARDLFMDGMTSQPADDGGVHVFHR